MPRRELFSLTVERGSREEVRLRRIRETKVEEVRGGGGGRAVEPIGLYEGGGFVGPGGEDGEGWRNGMERMLDGYLLQETGLPEHLACGRLARNNGRFYASVS